MITTDNRGSMLSAAQSRQSAADHQHVGEKVRHALGMERHEIAGIRAGHFSGEWIVDKKMLKRGTRAANFCRTVFKTVLRWFQYPQD